jgi:hypothetical protein
VKLARVILLSCAEWNNEGCYVSADIRDVGERSVRDSGPDFARRCVYVRSMIERLHGPIHSRKFDVNFSRQR